MQSIILHTTKGIPGGKDRRPQDIRPGFGPATDAGSRVARYWSRDGRQAGAHLVVDFDGSIACCADLERDAAFHAGACNGISIGIEIYQGSDAELYDGQLDVVVRLVDWLTRVFAIQRQIPERYHGTACARLVNQPRSFVGVYGHRDCSGNRGVGDPGGAIMWKLKAAGYEAWDLDLLDDMHAWKKRQQALRVYDDGVPGPVTAAALVKRGHPFGLWVTRPGDEEEPLS